MLLEVRLVLLVCACHALTHALMLLLPTVYLDIHGALALDYGRFGFLYGIVGFLFGAGALPVGALADRYGHRNMLVAGMAGAGVSTVAGGLASTPAAFMAANLLMGLFLAFYHPTGLSWVTANIPQRGKALGYHGVAGNLGMAIGPLGAGAITAAFSRWTPLEGWRVAFIVFGLVTLWVTWLVWCEPGKPNALVPHPAKPSYREFLPSMGIPLVLILINGLCFGLVVQGISAFLPKLVEEHVTWTGGDLALVGLITSGAFLAGTVGQLAGGYASHWFKVPEVMALPVFGIGAAMLIAMVRQTDGGFVWSAVLLNLFFFMWQPINNSLIATYCSPHLVGRAFGVYFTLQFAVGGLAPWLLGWVAEYFSLDLAFYVLAFIAVLGLANSVQVLWHRGSKLTLQEWWMRNRQRPSSDTPSTAP